ncbi:AAA family ATPase [Francisella philomiragia]|uniref:AAA family ATPase n=1 Tax=Francisella philomiragia TaxID=28110 RepID=UPI0019033657|nr:AAA family ATPase [Francisella philomiragia]MBK2266513.1 AAA family ATPase [Francisella philomiragia]MBK2278319.1 AAA family ATPase [Francisella philomiragia]MBK2286175.1 AAA family ATPase [Francisella philomiragia]MBK2287796.1 AAA family ATPase [Francisella philomiragia]MBK2290134.1 AAA family ATPase [Francisella philomiragia]
MITSIKLSNIASYKTQRELNTDKKINLVYGLNGVGKTTLSNFLKNIGDAKFSNCSITGGETAKILVYNQEFINENFYEKNDLKGVFTISEPNVTAEENVKIAKAEIDKLETQKKAKQIELDEINGANGKKKRNLSEATEKIWNVKTTFSGGDRILDYCLEGVKGSKDVLFNHIKSLVKLPTKPIKTIDDLKKEISKIEGNEAFEIALLQKIVLNGIENVENETIFDKTIVGNKDSTVADLIEIFQNSDWVKLGLNYLPDDTNETARCPFCQQNTITRSLADELKNYFDKTYEDKIDLLKKLKSQYQAIKDMIPNIDSFLVNDYAEAVKIELENLHTKLLTVLSQNITAIENKIKLPSNKVILQSSSQALKDFNELINKINQKITEHNEKIKNKKNVKDTIKKEFWEIMRWEYDAYISAYENDIKNLEKKEAKINLVLQKIKDDIKIQKDIIKENQDKTINVEKAIESINYQLVLLGLHGFEIKPFGDKFYRIVRDNESKPEFKSLSEGEKMIISFLYFIELCKGKESETEEIQDKIIVIDDPISSLSHNYIFNVAQLIKKEYFETLNYLQVFVLTHSMYFFHELAKIYSFLDRKNKNIKLFRIVRGNDKSSLILEMSQDEILNDYQAYWKVLKDHNVGNAHDNIVANAMRNILENFFGFIDNTKMKESISQIDSIKYGAFLRYIDRESHSDLTNISDFKEIDIELFKEAFKDIFEKSGNIKHYEKMIGEDNVA